MALVVRCDVCRTVVEDSKVLEIKTGSATSGMEEAVYGHVCSNCWSAQGVGIGDFLAKLRTAGLKVQHAQPANPQLADISSPVPIDPKMLKHIRRTQ